MRDAVKSQDSLSHPVTEYSLRLISLHTDRTHASYVGNTLTPHAWLTKTRPAADMVTS